MDQHQLSESSHGACTQNLYQFFMISPLLYEIPLWHTHPCQKCWKPPTNIWVVNQIDPTNSPETLATISKLK
jgi:hypothetical protein